MTTFDGFRLEPTADFGPGPRAINGLVPPRHSDGGEERTGSQTKWRSPDPLGCFGGVGPVGPASHPGLINLEHHSRSDILNQPDEAAPCPTVTFR